MISILTRASWQHCLDLYNIDAISIWRCHLTRTDNPTVRLEQIWSDDKNIERYTAHTTIISFRIFADGNVTRTDHDYVYGMREHMGMWVNINITVECHYDAVQFIMILHTALPCQQHNINETSNWQQTPHSPPSSASYEVFIVRIWEKTYHVIMTLYCIWEVKKVNRE